MRGARFASFSSIASKNNVVSAFLVGNALVWYFTVLFLLQSAFEPSELPWIAVVHFSGLILSALVGASLARNMERSRFLILWMVVGILASSMVCALNNSSAMIVGFVSFFLGASFGFGMPTCMSYFTDGVAIESRGRVSGIALLGSGIAIVGFGFFEVSLLSGIILGFWRFVCLLVFLWAKNYRGIERKDCVSSYKKILSGHSFVLYFVPWVVFSLVNYIAVPSDLNVSAENSSLGLFSMVQNVCMGVAAVLGGFFVDSVGRKRIAILGFTLLGLGTAVLSFLPSGLFLLFFNAVIDGVAWGFLLVLFVLTLWGDLSQYNSSEKYYALGVTPFFVSKLLEMTVGSSLSESISSVTLFSFAAFFLFLAVLPLVYAPETLPDKVMKKRELTIYVEKAQEIAEKYY